MKPRQKPLKEWNARHQQGAIARAWLIDYFRENPRTRIDHAVAEQRDHLGVGTAKSAASYLRRQVGTVLGRPKLRGGHRNWSPSNTTKARGLSAEEMVLLKSECTLGKALEHPGTLVDERGRVTVTGQGLVMGTSDLHPNARRWLARRAESPSSQPDKVTITRAPEPEPKPDRARLASSIMAGARKRQSLSTAITHAGSAPEPCDDGPALVAMMVEWAYAKGYEKITITIDGPASGEIQVIERPVGIRWVDGA